MVEKKRVFQYQDLESTSLFERANERDDRKDTFMKSGIKFFSPKEKKNRIRILPPTWENAKHYGFDAYIHYSIGRSNSSYLCPQKMGSPEDKCPICEEILHGTSKNDKEFVDKVKARRKVLVYVIDRDDEAAGPKLFPMPLSMDRNFVMQSVDDGTGDPLRIHHPDTGYDVSFEKEGIGIKTKYSGEVVARKSTPLGPNPADQERWLQFITDNAIPEVLEHKSYEYIKSAFEGRIVEEVEDHPKERVPERKEEPKPEKEPRVTLSREDKEELISDNFDFRLKEIRAMSDETIDSYIAEISAKKQPPKEERKEMSGTDKLKELKDRYGNK